MLKPNSHINRIHGFHGNGLFVLLGRRKNYGTRSTCTPNGFGSIPVTLRGLIEDLVEVVKDSTYPAAHAFCSACRSG